MKRALGLKGENIAASYLQKQGYHIMNRNFYTRYGELDIVCKKNGILVFVEVKTRSTASYGTPEEAITPRKMEHLRKAALIYLDQEKNSFKEIRFDVIGILLQAENIKINHINNAF